MLDDRRGREAGRRVVDIGGGTGGLRGPGRRARPPGHRRRPQPRRPGRSWTAGPRRAGSPTGSPGVQGDASRPAADLVPGRVSRPTWCSATACSRSSTTPPAAGRVGRACCVPAARSACWSPAARRGARPGDGRPLRPGRALLDAGRPGRAGRGPRRRFTADEVTALLDAAGFDDPVPARRPGLRRPGAQLAGRPRARCRRARCSTSSSAVADRPEYLALATQLHALARRR